MRSPHIRWLARTLCCCAVAAHGQSIHKSVAAAGAAAGTDGWILMRGTFGQSIVGSSGSALHSAALGFWTPSHDLNAAGVRASGQPTSSTLVSVAPNPFRGETTLRFVLAANDDVRLTVLDNTGRCVSTSPLMTLSAGAHAYAFAPGALPPATYRYTLSGAHTRMTGGMTVLK